MIRLIIGVLKATKHENRQADRYRHHLFLCVNVSSGRKVLPTAPLPHHKKFLTGFTRFAWVASDGSGGGRTPPASYAAGDNVLGGEGLSKNRRDDGTGRSVPPAAGGHIMSSTGQRDS